MVDSTFQQNYQDLKRYLSAAVFMAGLAVSGIGLVTQRAAQILGDSTRENASWVLIGLGAVIMIATSVAAVITEINLCKARKAEELAQHQRELEIAERRARGELTLDAIKVMVRTVIERSNDDTVSVTYRSFVAGSVVRTQDDDRDDSADVESDAPLLTDDGRDS